jgi:hypothetical protein
MNYDPLRLEKSDFYIPTSSCDLPVIIRLETGTTIKFQVATGSEFTTFCANTMTDLRMFDIYEGDDVLIILNDDFSHLIKVKKNNLVGNILGMDVLSHCNVTLSQGKITFS